MIGLVLALLTACFLVAPLFIVIPMSFSTAPSFQFPPPDYWLGYYAAFFRSPSWLGAVLNSFIIASFTTIATLALTIPAAMGFIRFKLRGSGVFHLLLMSPLITPHIIAALAYYGAFARIGIGGTHLAVVVAHISLCIPICFLIVSASVKTFDPSLERASMSLGATPLKTFWLVTFPVLRPGILVAALFTFLYSFEEPVVSLFIAGRDATTLPKKMFESIQLEADPIIAVVSTLLFAGAALAVISPLLVQLLTSNKGQR